MDKKNVVIGVSLVTLGLLTREYLNLVDDFKSLNKFVKENEERFEKAAEIVTEFAFEDIVENFDE